MELLQYFIAPFTIRFAHAVESFTVLYYLITETSILYFITK